MIDLETKIEATKKLVEFYTKHNNQSKLEEVQLQLQELLAQVPVEVKPKRSSKKS